MSITFSNVRVLKIGSVRILYLHRLRILKYVSVIWLFFHIYSPMQEYNNLSE